MKYLVTVVCYSHYIEFAYVNQSMLLQTYMNTFLTISLTV